MRSCKFARKEGLLQPSGKEVEVSPCPRFLEYWCRPNIGGRIGRTVWICPWQLHSCSSGGSKPSRCSCRYLCGFRCRSWLGWCCRWRLQGFVQCWSILWKRRLVFWSLRCYFPSQRCSGIRCSIVLNHSIDTCQRSQGLPNELQKIDWINIFLEALYELCVECECDFAFDGGVVHKLQASHCQLVPQS